MTVARVLVTLTAAAWLAGCLPVTSENPVGTSAGLTADPALFGTWTGKNPDDAKGRDAYFHFMLAKNGQIDIALAMAEGGSDDGWTALTARTATLGANRFLNAVMTYDQGKPVEGRLKNAILPLLYELSGKTLTVYQLDEEAVKAAIRGGRLQGTIAPGDNGDVALTASPAKLDAVMAQPDARRLFTRLLVLKKIE